MWEILQAVTLRFDVNERYVLVEHVFEKGKENIHRFDRTFPAWKFSECDWCKTEWSEILPPLYK